MPDLSAANFAVNIGEMINRLQLDADMIVRRIALQIWTEITKRTPVDTGRARASWMTTLDEPSDVLRPEGNYPAPAAPDLAKATIRNRIFIVDNVHYIVHLEEGSSKQAPAGMVRVSLAQVQAELETLIAKNTPAGAGAP